MITATLVAVGAGLVFLGRMLKGYEDKATNWAEELMNSKGVNND